MCDYILSSPGTSKCDLHVYQKIITFVLFLFRSKAFLSHQIQGLEELEHGPQAYLPQRMVCDHIWHRYDQTAWCSCPAFSGFPSAVYCCVPSLEYQACIINYHVKKADNGIRSRLVQLGSLDLIRKFYLQYTPGIRTQDLLSI